MSEFITGHATDDAAIPFNQQRALHLRARSDDELTNSHPPENVKGAAV